VGKDLKITIMADIIFKNFNKSYNGNELFKDFNLSFAHGKITAVLGNSGVGKTTLLNAMAGLIPYGGSIENAQKRISYIFQNQALLPNLTVFKNVELVLKSTVKDRQEREIIVNGLLGAVELFNDRNKYPSQLSIGMAQRVAMARAFAYPCDIILLDEPFRGLDISLKSKLINYFIKLWDKDKKTAILVTHGIDDAVLLADNIIVIGKKPVEVILSESINSHKSQRSLLSESEAEIYKKVHSALS